MRIQTILLEGTNDIVGALKPALAKNKRELIDYWLNYYLDLAREYLEWANQHERISNVRFADLKQRTYGRGVLTLFAPIIKLYDPSEREFRKGYRNELRKYVEDQIVEPMLDQYTAKFASKISVILAKYKLKDVKTRKFTPYNGGIIGNVYFEFEGGLKFRIQATVRTNYAPKSGYFFYQYPFTFKDVEYPDGTKAKTVSEKELISKISKDTGGKSLPSWVRNIKIVDDKYVFNVHTAILDLIKYYKLNAPWTKYIVGGGAYKKVVVDDLRDVYSDLKETYEFLREKEYEPISRKRLMSNLERKTFDAIGKLGDLVATIEEVLEG